MSDSLGLSESASYQDIKPLLLSIFEQYPQVYDAIYGDNSSFNEDLGYLIVGDITHYIKVLYQKQDFNTIKGILTLFDTILTSSSVGRNHILSSFCDIIGHYPDVMNGILSKMPDSLRNETLKNNEELV